MHGWVIFSKRSSVDSLMSKRPHMIDGQKVSIHRSVPNQGPLKEKKDVTNLIVSGIENSSIGESDLKQYFSGYGVINRITIYYEENACCIEFDE